jgi:hypothetical protein
MKCYIATRWKSSRGDDDYNLKGLITVKDIQKKIQNSNSAKDSHGRLIVELPSVFRDYLTAPKPWSKLK